MAFCSKCGTSLPEGVKFCPGCGAPTGDQQETPNTGSAAQANAGAANQANGAFNTDTINEKIAQFSNTKDSTSEFAPDDIQKNKGMALLSYIGILFIIPLLAAKDSKFAKFHVNQGIVLFIAELVCSIAVWIVSAILRFIPVVRTFLPAVLITLVSLAALAFMIIGILNAVNGRAKELPLIGSLKILQ